MATREPAVTIATCRLSARPLKATALLYLAGFVSSLVRPCGAFALSPARTSKLHLSHPCRSGGSRQDGLQRRGAAAATAAADLEYEKVPGEKKEIELRLQTWMEVESHVKREVAEVRIQRSTNTCRSRFHSHPPCGQNRTFPWRPARSAVSCARLQL